MSFSGDVESDDATATPTFEGSQNESQPIWCNGEPCIGDLNDSMGQSLADYLGNDDPSPFSDTDCFTNGVTFSYAHIQRERDNSVSVKLWFDARDKGDSKDIKYQIVMNGLMEPPDWPPQAELGNTVTLDWWELYTEGKGKDKAISCIGNAGDTVFETTVIIDFLEPTQ